MEGNRQEKIVQKHGKFVQEKEGYAWYDGDSKRELRRGEIDRDATRKVKRRHYL